MHETKIKIYLLYLIVILAINVNAINNTKEIFFDKTKLCNLKLDYDIEKNGVITLFEVFNNYIYISNGSSIYKYNKKGVFLKKIDFLNFSRDDIIIDFKIIDSNKELIYVNISSTFRKTQNGKDIFNIEVDGGEYLNIGIDTSMIVNYQTYDKNIDNIINGLAVINKYGNNTKKYSIKNMTTLNFEVINQNVYFITPKEYFYRLSLNDNNKVMKKKIDLETGNRYWFLGVINDLFVFKSTDYNKNIDNLYFFDNNFKQKKYIALNQLSYNQISKLFKENEELFEEFPTGNIYSYSEKNIYILRNTISGIKIYDLKSFITTL